MDLKPACDEKAMSVMNTSTSNNDDAVLYHCVMIKTEATVWEPHW